MQTIERLRYLAKFKGDQETLGSVPASLLVEAADEIERLRALVKASAGRITSIAFAMPPPNLYTPDLVMVAQSMERALHQQKRDLTNG